MASNEIITQLPAERPHVLLGYPAHAILLSLIYQFLYEIKAGMMPSSFEDIPHRVKAIFPSPHTLFSVVFRSGFVGSPPPLLV